MFEKIFSTYSWDDIQEKIYNAAEQDVIRVLNGDIAHPRDMLPLFSPAAETYLEQMAQAASSITRQRFGKVVQLYTPLYISNECVNNCAYCGFNLENDIRRTTLTPEQVEKEADIIYSMGFRHVLLLTGEHRKAVPVDYLASIARSIHKRFASVGIEVYPMRTDEYRVMTESGVDGLTLYQETYNKEIYEQLHTAGKKKDFSWRINGPERGGIAGFRKIGIGALLGLADWRVEGFFTALHALHLTRTFWKTHIQVSFPRLRGASGDFEPLVNVSDKNLTQLVCALRIILHDTGLVLSTREGQLLRDNLVNLGITIMSAGSKTDPGGYANLQAGENQFDICDDRSPDEIALMLKQKGFDPVWKDWDRDFIQTTR